MTDDRTDPDRVYTAAERKALADRETKLAELARLEAHSAALRSRPPKWRRRRSGYVTYR